MAERDTWSGFDPDGPGATGTLFGLPFTFDDADVGLVILPVPWEVTVSYGTGAARAPEAILEASTQVDLYDSDHPGAWKHGIAMAPMPEAIRELGARTRVLAERVIEAQSASTEGPIDSGWLAQVNDACETMVAHVRGEAERLLELGKCVAVLGGDHSAPLGLLQALAGREPDFGILHLDAHCDLRDAYEGFVHSHASIMHNALALPAVSKLVQVGVRDYSDAELEVVSASRGRIRLFDDRSLVRRAFGGESWATQVESIVSELPERVYISFDIDGLDPSLCPGTGTPVPGGLGFEQALYLVHQVVATGRTLIGFDLCEVSPADTNGGEWDANVGARVLYRLAGATLSATRSP